MLLAQKIRKENDHAHQYRYLRTFKKFIRRCRSRRDRETVARLVKECCIIEQDFEAACFYRERERENAPRRRANKVI